jgi:hypothetical protein
MYVTIELSTIAKITDYCEYRTNKKPFSANLGKKNVNIGKRFTLKTIILLMTLLIQTFNYKNHESKKILSGTRCPADGHLCIGSTATHQRRCTPHDKPC